MGRTSSTEKNVSSEGANLSFQVEAIQKLEEASYTIKYMKKDQAEFKDQMNRVEEYNKQLFEEMD